MRFTALVLTAALLGCAPDPGTDVAVAPAPGSGVEPAAGAAPAGAAGPAVVTAPMLPVDDIVATVHEAYRLISGPPGQPRDWDTFRRLFAPGARLSAIVNQLPPDSMRAGSRPTMVIMTPEDYVTRVGPRLEQDGFFEEELHHEVHRYGNVAQVFSSYVSRLGSPDSEPVDHGINSFQLVYGDNRWWIYSILWDSERRGAGPLPGAWAGE